MLANRWLWSALDLAGLICLGQATMLAQRQASVMPRLDVPAEAALTEKAPSARMRILDGGRVVVVAVPMAGHAAPPQVRVDRGLIRVDWGGGAEGEIPVPAEAEPSSWRGQRRGDAFLLLFEKKHAGALPARPEADGPRRSGPNAKGASRS